MRVSGSGAGLGTDVMSLIDHAGHGPLPGLAILGGLFAPRPPRLTVRLAFAKGPGRANSVVFWPPDRATAIAEIVHLIGRPPRDLRVWFDRCAPELPAVLADGRIACFVLAGLTGEDLTLGLDLLAVRHDAEVAQ